MPRLRGHLHSCTLSEFLHAEDNFDFEGRFAYKHFGPSEKIYVAAKLAAVNGINACASPSRKVGGDALWAWKPCEGQAEGVIEIKPAEKLQNIIGIDDETFPLKGSSEDAIEVDINPPTRFSSESDIKASLFGDYIPLGVFPRCCADTKGDSRDDENSVRCTQHGTGMKAYRSWSDIGHPRIRNLYASRWWRMAPNLKDGKTKQIYHSGRTCYNHQRSQKSIPFKKRKFFDQSLLSTSHGVFHCEDVFDSPDMRTNRDNCHLGASMCATGASSSVAGQQVSPELKDSNVKLSIKSFKVPELFIEMPATATVASLKRTVEETVTSILRDGLHIGILLQGKKVRDDSKTLLQTGISHGSKHCNLGFVLEPRHARIMPPTCIENPPFLSGSATEGLTRHTTSWMLQAGTSGVSPVPPEINFRGCFGSDLGAVSSIADTLTDSTMLDSQALVSVPAINIEALSVVPLHHRFGHPEFGRRRIRRPFSVSEVEALVQAVEKLGTGRWRDVKLRAFDNVNYRTYVDLKDKWKTLVHTARISPHKRRGEPVPQELLDRVLAADAYWSQVPMLTGQDSSPSKRLKQQFEASSLRNTWKV